MNTLRKALDIVDYVVKAPDGVRPSEIAKLFNMSLPNAYKYLKILEEYDFVIKRPDGAYIPSFKIVEYSSIILRRFDLRDIATPFLVDLMMKTGQNVFLVMKDGNEGVYIQKIESIKGKPMALKIGMKASLYSTSVGKAILSHIPKSELKKYLNEVKLERKTEKTITDPKKLVEELERTRKRGYSIDDEENEPGVRCIGAPILNHEGYPIAAVSVSGSVEKFTDEWIEENSKYVVECARKISEKLGYTSEG